MTDASVTALVRLAYRIGYSNGYTDAELKQPKDTVDLTDEQIALMEIHAEAKRLKLDD